MQTSHEIRLQNARLICRERTNGNRSEFGRRLGWSRSQAANYLKGKAKRWGDDAARDAERAFGLPKGWLDTPHKALPKAPVTKTQRAAPIEPEVAPGTGDVAPVEGVSGNRAEDCITGLIAAHSLPTGLAQWTSAGISMSPSIEPGDVVLFDQADVTVESEGAFIIAAKGVNAVRFIGRDLDGSLVVFSTNPAFPAQRVGPEDRSTFQVLGRAVAVVKVHRL